MTFMVVGSFLLEVNMDKKAIEKLKKELLTKRSHDIFKNVQAIFDLTYSTGDLDLCFKCRGICAQNYIMYNLYQRHTIF